MSENQVPFAPGPAASVLAGAWRRGSILEELPADIRPGTLQQGYDVQDQLIKDLGQHPVGWKLGMGSVLQKQQSGIGRSLAGRILRSYVLGDGDVVLLPNSAPVTVEFEIVYVLGRHVLPDEPPFSVLGAVAAVQVAFELVLSRFRDRRAVGWPSFVADNGAFQALVLGREIDTAAIAKLHTSLTVTLNGVEVARSLTGEDQTDAEAALEDLVALARERHMVLPSGSLISTGTVSRPFTFAGQAQIEAQFAGRSLRFRSEIRAGNAA